MKSSVDSFVTVKERLFAFLFQFHLVGLNERFSGGVTCAENVRAPCVLQCYSSCWGFLLR